MNASNVDPARLGELLRHLSEGSSDPTVPQVVQLLLQFLTDDEEDRPDHRLDMARVRRENRRLLRHVHLLERRNQLVAGAMGACSCWGADPDCEECAGEGAPGYRHPAPTAFEALVVPLVRAQRDAVLEILRNDAPPTRPEGADHPAAHASGTQAPEPEEVPDRDEAPSYSAALEEVWS